MDGNDDDVNSLSLLEYYAPHTKPDRNLEAIETNRIADIFQPFQENDNSSIIPKFILIEGAPGMGKTILCKEIAYQWANQCLLKDTKLLFLIHLRDLAISNIEHLKDLIHYLYAFDEAAIELSKECAKILNERNGDGLTILFDGFDEFDSSSNSLITNILGRKVLPQCRIVVTSRLTASDRLHRLADVRVEVMGFTDESKMQYIKQELKDYPDEIKKLQLYFDDHPSIKSICYMPMMMTILVYVFKEKGCLPNNPTELYEIFVALTISHYLQKQLKSEHLFTSVQTLPTGCKAFLTDLSKFAFLTLQSKQKIFTKEDIEKYCPNSVLAKSTLDSLGLINSVEYFCIDRGHSTVCSFLHLSIHEYLAALYISSIDQCMQFKELENTFLNEMCQETWNMFTAMNKRTWLTFQNYCVYCKDSYQESLSTWIANVKSSSFAECITKLYDSLHDIQISSKIIQILFSQSTQSPKSNAYLQQIYLSLSSRQHIKQIEVQMFIFDKGTNDLNSKWFAIIEKLRLTDRFSVVFCTNNVLMLKNINQLDKFKFKTAIKWFSLVHCHISRSIIKVIVNHLNLYNVSRFDIVSCTFDDGEVSDELTSTTQPNQALSTSHLCGNNLKHSAVVILQALSKLSSLNMLNLQSNQLDKDAGEYISSIVLSNAGLRILLLDDNKLNAGVLHIAKALQHHSTLEVLSLGGTNIPAEVYGDLALAIDCNQSLKVVRLHNNNLQSSAVIVLQALSRNSSLNTLNLHSNNLNKEASKCLSSIIFNNIELTQLVLDNNDINKGIFQIAKALQQINSLQILSLGNTNLPKEVSDELALVIECNQCLSILRLNGNNLHSSAVVILQALSKLSSLRVLNLKSTELTEDVGECISYIVLNNNGLNQLFLGNNDIGRGALPIAKALQKINSLQVLGLGDTNLPKEVCDELALVIERNQCLTALQLNNNDLQCSAVVILQTLSVISSLRVLHLQSTQLNEDVGEYVSSIILNNTGINELILDNNNIGKGVLCIAKALQRINSLQVLRLKCTNIPKVASNDVAIAIECNKQLYDLDLSGNNLQSAVVILQALCNLSSLKMLNLQGTQLTESIGEYLSCLVFNNPALHTLYLTNNNIGKGVLHLAKALQSITSLKFLGLGYINFPAEVCDELPLAIQSNQCLESLWLPCNGLNTNVLQSMISISTLTDLNLISTQLLEEAGEVLSSIILHNTRLVHLRLSNNSLGNGALHVMKALQHLTQLRTLHLCNVTSGGVVSEECGEALSYAMSNNNHLEDVDLSNNNIQAVAVHVVKGLQQITSLKVLNLGNCNLPKKISAELARVINCNKYLEQLLLPKNNLGSSAVVLLQAMSKTLTLKVLSLGGNQMIEEVGEYLSHLIFNNPGLNSLLLNNNNIGKGVLHIAKALQNITSLKTLGLGYNSFSAEVCDELALSIQLNQCLESLWLPCNGLNTNVLQSMISISTLTGLNLISTQLLEEAGEVLSSIILHNTRLVHLRLSNNSLGNGALHVMKALQHLTQLRTLHLCNVTSGGIVSEECGKALSYAMSNNNHLEDVDLSNNNIQAVAVHVVKGLQQITSLKVLNLGNCNLPKKISAELARVIDCNKYLEQLLLPNNNLGSSVVVLLQAMSKTLTLKVLSLGGNQMTEEAGEYFASVISKNHKLEQLLLGNNNLGKGVSHIVRSLQGLVSLQVLDLGNTNTPKEACDELAVADTNFPKEAADELALVIECNQCLNALQLNGNDLRCSAVVILQGLSKLSSLRVLNLQSTQLNEHSGEYMSSMISNNTGLSALLLDNNDIGKGVLPITKALQQLNSLQVLGLRCTNMPKEAFSDLALVIKFNKYLRTLRIDGNSLQPVAVVILQALCRFLSLKILDLNANQMSEYTSEYLSRLIYNHGLNGLLLSGNNTGNRLLCMQIARAVQNATSLEGLGLGYNSFPAEVCDQLALAIHSDQCLELLWLPCNGLNSNVLQSMISISTLTDINLKSAQLLEEAGEILSSIILHNTKLVHLDLSNNSLDNGTLHVMKALQHLTQLRTLHLCNVTSGGVVSEECGEALSYAMSNNSHLEDVDLSNNNIQAVAVHVVKGLQQITSLKVLNLGNCNLPKKISAEVARVIDCNKYLEKLLLPNNNISSSAVIILQALSRTLTLKVVNFQGNQMTEEVGEYLSHLIFNNPGLNSLLLNNNNIGKGVLHIAKALQNITSLKTLGLGYNSFSAEVCDELALSIQLNQCLESLWLPCNGLNTNVLQSMISISTLTDLNLISTQLLEEAGEVLSSIILHNTRLVHLRLSNNSLGNGALHVMKALQHLTQLRTLHLCNVTSGGIVSEECGKALSYAMSNNNHLEDVDLSNNNIQAVAVHVVKGLQQITSLKVLNLGNCYLPKKISAELARIIDCNKYLEQLLLPNNNLGSSVVVLLQAMSKTLTLKVLSLGGNQMTEEAGEYFASVISKNHKLEQLLLGNNNLGKGVSHIVRSLQGLVSLQVLDLGNTNTPKEACDELAVADTNFPKEAADELALVIECNQCLNALQLNGNDLRCSAVVILQGLSKLSSLRVLNLQSTQLNEHSGEYMSSMISNNTGLSALLLDNNDIGKGVLPITKALQQLNSLQVLGLSCTNMPQDASNDLALAIKCNKHLYSLNLDGNNLQSAAVVILQALCNLSSLKILDLEGTQLTESTGEYLSCLIFNNPKLNTLGLSNNNIGKGVLHIAKALQNITSLKILGLGYINFPAEVCDKLALAIQSNQCLESLWLPCNGLNTNVLQSMISISTLTDLNLISTQLLEEAEVLSSIILHNTRLVHLRLSNNSLGNGALHVMKALQHLTQLRTLHLCNVTSGGVVSEECGEALSYAMSNNNHLEDVDLSNNNIQAVAVHVVKGLQQITSLKVLNLGNCNLPKKISAELARVINCNKYLEQLLLPKNNLGSSAVVLLQAMSKTLTLKVLSLGGNQMIEEVGEYLSHLIFNNPGLNSLLLNNNNIGKGVLHIAKALQNITSLKTLGLGYNSFSAEVCDELALSIQLNQCLESLWLPCNGLNTNVLQSMISISTLTGLNLISTQLLEEAGEVLSSIILHNTRLVHLRLSNNSLGNGALHVMKALQHLTQLRTLHLCNVTSGGVVSEECGEALSYAMSNNNHLEDVDLSNNNIQAVAVHVVKGLQQITSLKVLNLGNCNLPKKISAELARVINCNKYLEQLLLPKNNLGSSAVVLLQAMSKTLTLKVLSLGGNQMIEEVGEYLSHLIFNNPGLNSLLLNNNNIGKGVLHIAKALQNITSLKTLGLGYNSFSAEVCDELALSIQLNQCLESLWLPCNGLNTNVLQSMISISTLTGLNLISTQLLEEAGEVLSSIILHNTRLVHLRLSNNSLGNGALHVMKALQHLTQLRTLHLCNVTSGGIVSEECGKALSYAMSNNNHLEDVDLSNNNIQAVAVHVVKGLQQITSLKVLNLGNCYLPKKISAELARIIDCNKYLEQLLLPNNNLGSSVVVLLQAMSKTLTLKVLSLGGNQMTEEAGEYFASVISKNHKLEQLLLGNNNLGKGVSHIVRSLQGLVSLQVLDLGNTNTPKEACDELAVADTNFPKEAADELALVIECNQCLNALQLNGNDLRCSAVVILQGLSKLSSLRVLNLQSTQLNEHSGEYMSSMISNNTGLSALLLDNNDIGKGVLPITKALQQLNSLQVLGLSCTNMPQDASNDLALAIKCNKHLYSLNLDGNNLQSAAVVILQALCNLSSLKILDLEGTQLTESTGEYLSRLIFNNPELNTLGLSNNNIGKGVLHIAKALQNITSLKILGLGYINFPAEVCDKLALAIQSNQCLESLWLPCNGLNTNVLQSMISISTLTELDLDSTQLLEAAGEVLSCIILHNTTLVHLCLSNNNLGNGVLHVTKAIQHLTQLRTLHLSNVTSGGVVSEECGKALSYAMSNNSHLEDVDLSNNNIQAVAVHVVKGLQQITSLKVLNLGNCNLPNEVSTELARVINCNKCLAQLLLPDNNLGSSTVIILEALSRISTLKVLNLQGNQITEEAGEYIAFVINKNPELEQLLAT